MGYGRGDAKNGTIAPGSEVMVLAHVLHHFIHRPVLLDIQPMACLPVLLPFVDHVCAVH